MSEVIGKQAPQAAESTWRQFSNLRYQPIQFLQKLFHDHGDVVAFHMLKYPGLVISNPNDVSYIYKDNARNFDKNTLGWKKLRNLLGQGLLTSEGAYWLRQRRMAQPLFHRHKFDDFSQITVKNTKNMLEKWKNYEGREIDISEEMAEVALKISGEILFNMSGEQLITFGKALAVVLQQSHIRMTSVFDLPMFIPTPFNRKYTKALRIIDNIIFEIIDKRRREATKQKNFLSMLIDAEDKESGEKMSDEQIKDEVFTMLVGGHETIALSLAWMWMILSQYPYVRQKVKDEVFSTLGSRHPTIDDVSKLQYTDMVIKEVLRLYPPVWMMGRSSIKEDVIGGYYIPPKTMLFTSQYVIHRHPEYWENPEGFDPDRFSPDKAKKIHRYAYFPFGCGQHLCIGGHLAMVNMTLITAMVIQQYELNLISNQSIEFDLAVSLRPKKGIIMDLKKTSKIE